MSFWEVFFSWRERGPENGGRKAEVPEGAGLAKRESWAGGLLTYGSKPGRGESETCLGMRVGSDDFAKFSFRRLARRGQTGRGNPHLFRANFEAD